MGSDGNKEVIIESESEEEFTPNVRKDLLVPDFRGLSISVPKNIATYDEKYALRCHELIRRYAVSLKFFSRVDSLPDDLNNLPRIEIPGLSDITRFTTETQTKVLTNSTEEWTFGAVSYSPSMVKILRSSLLREFGGKTSLLEAVNTGFSDSSKEVFVESWDPKPMHKRVVSISSDDSSCSEKSSPSSNHSFRGMLQLNCKNGLSHLSFTVDGKKEVLLAELTKQESSDGKVTKHVYTFKSRKKGKKERGLKDFEIVGKMEASTASVTIDRNNETETVETRFVLSVRGDGDHGDELQTSRNKLTEHKRLLTRKVSNAFRRRSSSKFEDILPRGPSLHEDTKNLCPVEIDEVTVKQHNFESAAIVVRNVFKNRDKEADSGGWGLKFLKRLGHNTSRETSTSFTVIIPAGAHGGPRTEFGGPSSLVERWANGGSCDCGGWDIGCPLTVLEGNNNNTLGKCKSVDLFVKGSKRDFPVMKMVNINEDLYYLQFQSRLSILQSFAIAASILHSRFGN